MIRVTSDHPRESPISCGVPVAEGRETRLRGLVTPSLIVFNRRRNPHAPDPCPRRVAVRPADPVPARTARAARGLSLVHRCDRRATTMPRKSHARGGNVQGVLMVHRAAPSTRGRALRTWGARSRVRAASAEQGRPHGSPKASFRIVRSTFLNAAARQLPTPGRRPGFPGPRTGSSRAPHGRLWPRGEAERVLSFVPGPT